MVRGSTGILTSGTVTAAGAADTVGRMRSPAPALRCALAGAAVVLLTACGGSGDDEPAAAPSTSTPATSSSAPASGTAAADPAAQEFCGQMTSASTELEGALSATGPEEVAARLPEVVTRLEQVAAPPEISGDWGALLDGLRRLSETAATLDLSTPEGQQAYTAAEAEIGQELGEAQTALSAYVVANCGLTPASPTG